MTTCEYEHCSACGNRASVVFCAVTQTDRGINRLPVRKLARTAAKLVRDAFDWRGNRAVRRYVAMTRVKMIGWAFVSFAAFKLLPRRRTQQYAASCVKCLLVVLWKMFSVENLAVLSIRPVENRTHTDGTVEDLK